MKNNEIIINTIKKVFKENWESVFMTEAVNDFTLTYKDFFKKAKSYANALENSGIKKGDIISVIVSNRKEAIILYFGALILQATIAPVDPNKGENEIAEILELTGQKLIVHDKELKNINANSIYIDVLEDKANSFIGQDDSIEQTGIFDDFDYEYNYLITFTSGTTGAPKGVMHSFKNLFYTALAFSNRFKFDTSNIFYHNLPMTYMAGILNQFILPFISGSRLVIGERFSVANISRFWDFPIKYGVNVFWINPTIVSMLLKLDRGTKGVEYGKANKVIACVGTAALNIDSRRDFEKKYNIRLFESYGLSELLFITTNSPDRPYVDNSVGELLEGVCVSFDEDGEVLVDVPWMYMGYSNLDSSEFFKDGKYRTGDIGEIDENGFLKITGRKKDIIIRGGINISPRRTEIFISDKGIFTEFVILGLPDPVIGEKTVCCYIDETETFDDAKRNALNKEIISQLGNDYRIDEYHKLIEIPRNLNGKIDKNILKQQFINRK